MPVLTNSKRCLWQATYTPGAPPGDAAAGSGGQQRGLEKFAYITALRLGKEELADLRRQIAHGGNPQVSAAVEAVAQAMESGPISGATALAPVAVQALVELGSLVLNRRRTKLASIPALVARIQAAYDAARASSDTAVSSLPPPGWLAVPGAVIANHPGAAIYRVARTEGASPPTDPNAEDVRVERSSTAAMIVRPPDAAPAQVPREPSLGELLAWAASARVEEAAVGTVREVLDLAGINAPLAIGALPAVVTAYLESVSAVVTGFAAQSSVEPIGFLHLERMNFTPAGIERGELLHSVPLAPSEEVNIAHKEWSNTSEEFQKLVTDFLDAFSEEGVAEKSELAQASSSQTQHTSGLDMSVTASGGYGPVNVSASISRSVADSATKSQQFSRNQSVALTRKASSRVKKEHKISFKVASASGTEDQAVRRIKNPFEDRTTRLDYYQLVRKWKVDLFRYGLRLTYDLVVPEPGLGILGRIQEINAIRAALDQGFNSGVASIAWARFDLEPQGLTRSNYAELAAKYGVALPPPPPEEKHVTAAETRSWTRDEAKHNQYYSLELDVDGDYLVERVSVDSNRWFYTNTTPEFWVPDASDFVGKSGKLTLVYGAKALSSAFVKIDAVLRLTDAAMMEWRMKAWGGLRDAALARYYENRQMLKERLDRLNEEIGATDALSLRKIEREEVMKCAMRWLFGPGFAYSTPGIGAGSLDDGQVVSPLMFSQIQKHGELIKFIHQAIEWENMLFFLYPYFWSHASRWGEKKFLNHPDATHRAFLKAGSARVVPTIRPGFERAFASFIETGTLDPLAPDHPYLRIAEEIEAYANTNYPGVASANPANSAGPLEDDSAGQGVNIGTWFEYVPTSALDIGFDAPLPSG